MSNERIAIFWATKFKLSETYEDYTSLSIVLCFTLSVFSFSMNESTINLETTPSEEDRRKILDGLYAHNKGQTGDGDYENLTFLLRDTDGEVVGGLLGEIYWGWLHVDVLWVHETLRQDGHGRKLMDAAEREAAARGCHSAFLDTFSFQALPFYLRLGYEIFGELPDFPPGHGRYFLRKLLTKDT